ncbi:MAG: hypothetical protein R6U98_27075, partial [Pirellulaceae bacterium]
MSGAAVEVRWCWRRGTKRAAAGLDDEPHRTYPPELGRFLPPGTGGVACTGAADPVAFEWRVIWRRPGDASYCVSDKNQVAG